MQERRKRKEDRGKRKEERGKRKEERGKKKEERGKRKEERGKRKEERGKRKEERGKRKEERGKRKEERGKIYYEIQDCRSFRVLETLTGYRPYSHSVFFPPNCIKIRAVLLSRHGPKATPVFLNTCHLRIDNDINKCEAGRQRDEMNS